MTAAQVVAQLEDGMTIGIGGWGPRRKPMALVREILRSGLRDLTVVSYGGADVGMLCAAGRIRKLVFGFVTLDFIPLEPHFRKARQSGAIEVMELDEGMLLLGLRAAAWRLPYIPTRVGLGTDIVAKNPDLKLVDSPYDDRQWVAVPPLHLDAALLHVHRADARGVCQIDGPDHYMDDLMALAAQRTYVSCDELVESSYFHPPHQARLVLWDRGATTGVVPIAGGAHPSSCDPLYGFDEPHFREYAAAARDEAGFAGYAASYLQGSEADYQDAVGGLQAIQALPLPVY